jgi:drug/metabolite transporter (DMT)-like permease
MTDALRRCSVASVSEGPLPSADAPISERRQPLLGYAMVLTAATLWAVNGTVSKVILASGDISAPRLAEVRATGSFAGLLLALAILRPASLRVSRAELPFLVAFGVLGLALVQWFYFAAIERLEIGIALLIQYTAPLLVALWARFVLREPVRPRLWVALILALGGLVLIVDIWRGLTLDGLGVSPPSERRSPSPRTS